MIKYSDLSEIEVKKLAYELGQSLKNKTATIGFVGPLGSGKTTFIKSLAKSFGIKKISSPTFVISHEYVIAQGKLFHLDFYRLSNSKQLEPLGLEDMLKNKNIVLLEWADRFPKIAKLCDIIITLKVKSGNKRDVWIKAQ